MVPTGTSIVFDMSLTYILVALAAVLLNNVLVERLSLHTRITAGTSALGLTPLGEKVGSGSGWAPLSPAVFFWSCAFMAVF